MVMCPRLAERAAGGAGSPPKALTEKPKTPVASCGHAYDVVYGRGGRVRVLSGGYSVTSLPPKNKRKTQPLNRNILHPPTNHSPSIRIYRIHRPITAPQ
eukprot:4255989-Pyramimonas_sp.AAC.1